MKYLFILVLVFIYSLSFAQYNRKVDKFTDEIVCRFASPNISFYKYINSADTMYQTAFVLYDSYLTVSGKDAILLFSDGSKLELKGEVNSEAASSSNYRYTFYTYGKEVVEKLSKINIEGFKLHIFEKNISSANRPQIKNAAKTILVSK